MRFETFSPPASLEAHVLEFWFLEDDGRFHAGLPKPYVELVVSLAGTHWWRANEYSLEHRYWDSWITPLQRATRYARATGGRRLIGARLQPWTATALFGRLPPGDGLPPPRLERFIGSEAAHLRGQLLSAGNTEHQLTIFAAWISRRLTFRRDKFQLPVMHADVTSVTDLANAFNCTARSLRRRFARDYGMSPKTWLKLRRLDRLLRDRALRNGSAPLAEIALESGYSDQSHCARDVSQFTGMTPSSLRRRPPGSPPHLLPRG